MKANIPPSKVMIMAGEASGDLLAGSLVNALKKTSAQIQFSGMGGRHMRDAGVDVFLDPAQISVVGIFEVLTHLPKILGAMRLIKQRIKRQKPDLLILIDFPDFNLRIAKIAKKYGVKVLYYVSPQIWAWRYSRVHTIKKRIDHMAVLFPFEKVIYDNEQIPATFVGHPLSQMVKASLPTDAIYRELSVDPNKPVISLMPGSRRQEVQRMLPLILQAIPLIQQQIPNVQFIMPIPKAVKSIVDAMSVPANIKLVLDNTYNALAISDAAITKSGTVTLETALMGVPMVIIYKIANTTYQIAKRLVRTPFIGLCNIVAQEMLAKELIQHDANPQAIADEVISLLQDSQKHQHIAQRFHEVGDELRSINGADRTRDVVLEMLNSD